MRYLVALAALLAAPTILARTPRARRAERTSP